MSDSRALALAALAKLRIDSPTSWSWCGQPSARLDRKVARAMSRDVAREYLLYQLQQELYVNFYCRGLATPEHHRPVRLTPLAARTFVEVLSAHNRGSATRQPGWKIVGQEDGRTVVKRDGLSLWVAPAETVNEGPVDTVSLRLPCERRKASPGFYLVLGELPSTEAQDGGLVRIYWHLTSAAAPKLIECLSRSLNRRGVPFQLKVVDDPERYERCDAGVLYVAHSHFDAIVESVRAAHELLRDELRALTPVFTKPLAPGLGLAEDPGDGQSFGMHRVALLAEAAVRAYESGREPADEHAGFLAQVFDEQGLDLDRPYLNPGSTDRYSLGAR